MYESVEIKQPRKNWQGNWKNARKTADDMAQNELLQLKRSNVTVGLLNYKLSEKSGKPLQRFQRYSNKTTLLVGVSIEAVLFNVRITN